MRSAERGITTRYFSSISCIVHPASGIGLLFTQFLLEQGVHQIRVCLALTGLHEMTNEEAEKFLLACPVIRGLCRIRLDHFIYDLFYLARVRYLYEPLLLNNGPGVLAGLVHLFEHRLRDLGADNAVVDHL